MKTLLKHFSVFSLSWAVGYACIYYLFEYSQSRVAYGLIFGWWMCAYYCQRFDVSIMVLKFLAPAWILVVCVDIFLDLGFFYEDGAGSQPTKYFLMSLAGLLIFVSPLFFNVLNSLIFKWMNRLARK